MEERTTKRVGKSSGDLVVMVTMIMVLVILMVIVMVTRMMTSKMLSVKCSGHWSQFQERERLRKDNFVHQAFPE